MRDGHRHARMICTPNARARSRRFRTGTHHAQYHARHHAQTPHPTLKYETTPHHTPPQPPMIGNHQARQTSQAKPGHARPGLKLGQIGLVWLVFWLGGCLLGLPSSNPDHPITHPHRHTTACTERTRPHKPTNIDNTTDSTNTIPLLRSKSTRNSKKNVNENKVHCIKAEK